MSQKGQFLEKCICGVPLYTLPVILDYMRFQHGENPEHVLTITGREACAFEWDREKYKTLERASSAYIQDRLMEWVDAIHAFEQDGMWAGAPNPSTLTR